MWSLNGQMRIRNFGDYVWATTWGRFAPLYIKIRNLKSRRIFYFKLIFRGLAKKEMVGREDGCELGSILSISAWTGQSKREAQLWSILSRLEILWKFLFAFAKATDYAFYRITRCLRGWQSRHSALPRFRQGWDIGCWWRRAIRWDLSNSVFEFKI